MLQNEQKDQAGFGWNVFWQTTRARTGKARAFIYYRVQTDELTIFAKAGSLDSREGVRLVTWVNTKMPEMTKELQ